MKFSEYLENLQDLLHDRPELIDAEVIYSIDDEGNDYKIVHYGPTPGNYYDLRGDFVTEKDIEDDGSDLPTNAILIN
jgi:hypothetical protein